MQVDIQRGALHLATEMEEYIRERADFLLAFHRDLIACRVTVDAPVVHNVPHYEVKVDLQSGDGFLTATEQAEELKTAVRLAFEAVRRKLTGRRLMQPA